MSDIRLSVPADKSISHRALCFAYLCRSETVLYNLSQGLDVQTTLEFIEQSKSHTIVKDKHFTYHNQVGLNFINSPISKEVNCKNSGTTARILLSILSSRGEGSVTISGDQSLSKRPMERIVVPLQNSGANIEYITEKERLPIKINASNNLSPIIHSCETASAQIKTSLMFAALGIEGLSKITLPKGSRDHTEKMFSKLGLSFNKTSCDQYETIEVQGKQVVPSFKFAIPGDPSSAAYFCALKLLKPDLQTIHINGVCNNPNRLSFLKVMRQMGLRYELTKESPQDGIELFEPTTTISLLGAPEKLSPIHISREQVPALIDELPLLIVLSGLAEGESVFEGLTELRLKESDRLTKSAELLNLMGRETLIAHDRIVVRGNTANIKTFQYDTHSDHRMAMIAGLMAQVSSEKVSLTDKDCVEVSFPYFWKILERVCGKGFKKIHSSC